MTVDIGRAEAEPIVDLSSQEGFTLWLHKKSGNHYQIIGFCVIEADATPAVMYRLADAAPRTVWIRPCSEFFDGRFKQLGN